MPNLTQQEMSARISAMGLKRSYRPVNDPSNTEREAGNEIILLETRKFEIKDGVLKGSQIDVYDSSTVRVWTHKKKKAAAVARAVGCKVRLLDGEAELYLPAARADEFLHAFGAKVKRPISQERLDALARVRASMTPEQIEKRNAALAAARLARKAQKAGLATPV